MALVVIILAQADIQDFLVTQDLVGFQGFLVTTQVAAVILDFQGFQARADILAGQVIRALAHLPLLRTKITYCFLQASLAYNDHKQQCMLV